MTCVYLGLRVVGGGGVTNEHSGHRLVSFPQ